MTAPLVSVVTPFHNTARWLPDCIESVLAQTYQHWEYILLDNCSTDGSGEIAQRYAARDRRVRYQRTSRLLPQVQNYNEALTLIADSSAYCKIVQADDMILPDCVRAMTQVFEAAESVGLVGSYYLKGTVVKGSGLTYPGSVMSGRTIVQLLLRDGVFVFGSPTAVMYRSSIVRNRRPFYNESRLHEDTDVCIEILHDWDFGFVHQVLSFLRVSDDSISAGERPFGPDYLDAYIAVRRYASRFLPADEAAVLELNVRRHYYRFLADAALSGAGEDFWRFHRGGLETIGEHVDQKLLVRSIGRRLVRRLLNPSQSLATVRSLVQRLTGRKALHGQP